MVLLREFFWCVWVCNKINKIENNFCEVYVSIFLDMIYRVLFVGVMVYCVYNRIKWNELFKKNLFERFLNVGMCVKKNMIVISRKI